MRGIERTSQRRRDLDKLQRFERSAPKAIVERLALEQFHHDELAERPVLADIVNRADVGMVERRDGTCLALEALECVGVRVEVLRERFQRDDPAEARVSRAIHLAHAARSERADDFIGADTNAGRERHVAGLYRYR